MCRLKSGIILKDRIFIPEYDSHTKMLEELGIEDNYFTASKTFVRFELLPKDNDVFTNIDDWRLNIDQDIVPDWYNEEIYKPRVIERVKDWAKKHIHIGIDNLNINSGDNHYIKDCKNVHIYGNATVDYICGSTLVSCISESVVVNEISDNSAVDCVCGRAVVKFIGKNTTIRNIYTDASVWNIFDNATIENIFDNTTIRNICNDAFVKNICGDAFVENIHGNAIIENIHGRAIVKNVYDNVIIKNIFNNALVISSNFGWKNKNLLSIFDNATFKDCNTKTIYQSKDWKFINVNKSTNIEHK